MKYCTIVIVLVSACSGCTYNANRLAGMGAATGAIAGAAIGKDPKAALIGGAIGAASGAAVGGALDEQEARNEALIAQQMGQRLEGAVTHQQVVQMTQAGLSEQVIMTHISTYGVARPPNANDLIMLRQAGVGDGVLQALQTAGGPQPIVAVAPPQPVIVEERVIAPVVHVPVGCRPRRVVRPGFHWGFQYHH